MNVKKTQAYRDERDSMRSDYTKDMIIVSVLVDNTIKNEDKRLALNRLLEILEAWVEATEVKVR